MAKSATSSRWDHTAALLCKFHNLHRGKRDRPAPISAFHPYRSDTKNAPRRQQTTPAQLHQMKGMFRVITVRA